MQIFPMQIKCRLHPKSIDLLIYLCRYLLSMYICILSFQNEWQTNTTHVSLILTWCPTLMNTHQIDLLLWEQERMLIKMKHFKTWVKEGKALYAYGHTFTDSHMYFHEFMVQILLFFFFHYLNIFNLYENHCIKIKANLKWMNKISFRISKRNVMKWRHLEFLKTDFCLCLT